MTFISSEVVDELVGKRGMVWTLKNHGRSRVAPGFTVADYVKIGEFFAHAHHPKAGDLAHWDKVHLAKQ